MIIFNKKLNLKKMIVVVIICALILIVLSVLYNISFKYNKNDPFFKQLIVRSHQLSDNYIQDRFYKGFQNLNNAYNSSFEQKQEVFDAVLSSNFTKEFYKNLLFSNIKGIKDCSSGSCFAKNYTDLFGNTFSEHKSDDFIKFQTPDGISYALKITSENCSGIIGIGRANITCGYGFIDINGKKGPNQLGVDLLDVGTFFYAVKRTEPHQEYYTVATTSMFFNEEASNNCLDGRGYGCSWFVAEKIPSGVYLKSKKPIVSEYSFHGNYYHLYLTPQGRLIFFDNDAWVQPFTLKNIFANLKYYKKYITFIAYKKTEPIRSKFNELGEKKKIIKSKIYKKFPNLKPKPKVKKNSLNKV